VHKQTTAYHPQANGLVERLHRQLKEALRARLQNDDWERHLPWVLLGLRAAPKEDSAISAAELVFGTKLTLPGELLTGEHADTADLVERLHQRQFFNPLPLRAKAYEGAARADHHAAQLQAAKFVYVRRGGVQPALAAKYDGPYSVVSAGPKYFKIVIGGGVETVSVDRLKPHVGSSAVQAGQPSKRGRPPTRAAPARVQ
jgi:hypothetical protein